MAASTGIAFIASEVSLFPRLVKSIINPAVSVNPATEPSSMYKTLLFINELMCMFFYYRHTKILSISLKI